MGRRGLGSSEAGSSADVPRGPESWYRTVLEALGAAVVVHDRSGTVVEANAEAERVLGVPRQVLIGATPFDPRWRAIREDGSLFPPEEYPAVVTLRTAERCRGVVMRIDAKARFDRYLLVDSEPLVHPGTTELAGVVMSFTDITDLHRAEAKFRTLADNSPDFIVRYDRDGRRLYANQALADAYGVTPDELIGSVVGEPDQGPPQMIAEPESVARLREAIANGFEHGISSSVEVRYETSGGVRITECRLVPERDTAGVVVDMLLLGRDVTELLRVSQELAERESRYRAVFENALDSMYLLEVLPDGQHFRNIEVNPALERSTGIPRSEMIGRTMEESVPPEVAEAVNAKYRRCVAAGEPIVEEVQLDLPSGRRWYHSTLVPARDQAGRVHRIVGITRDVTERVEFEQALSDSEERFRLAFDGSLIGMAQLAVDSEPRFRHLRVNHALCELLGYSDEDLLDLRLADVVLDEDLAAMESALEDLLAGQVMSYRAERRFRQARRGVVWGLVSAVVVSDADGHSLYVLIQIEDVTARKRAEGQLVYRALHDELTGLPNRALVVEHLGNALARARRTGATVAVLFLDLDDFKSINDSFGHTVGDEFLTRVAARIRRSVRAGDIAARVGGDEFVIVCDELDDPNDASTVAGQIQVALSPEIQLHDHLVSAPASIGIATSTGDSTPEAMLRDADAAMYVAKHRGGRRWEPADASLHAAAMRVLTVEAELRRALANSELDLHYQPVVHLQSEAIVSVEALLRWQHPERGLVLPGEFIDVAEQRGLIREIGEWVLRRACTQAAAWRERFGDGAPWVAVNVSARQLGNAGLTTTVREALDSAALAPDRLCLEVTESQLLMVGTSATTDLRTLSELGLRLAVDDFGTGHSGFDYLRRMPVSELKIDKSFVDGLGTDATNTAITASVVALANSLGLDVVAEGVERPAQRDALLEMGCRHGQGWLWHRAMPPEDIEDLLRSPSTEQTS